MEINKKQVKQTARAVLKTVSEVGSLYLNMRNTRGPLALTLLGANTVSSWLNNSSNDKVCETRYELACSPEAAVLIQQLATLDGKAEKDSIYYAIGEGIRLIVDPKNRESVCVDNYKREQHKTLYNAVANILWKNVEAYEMLARETKAVEVEVIETEKGKKLYDVISQFDKGRCAFIYGPPGTGKTTIAVDIGWRFGRVIHVPVSTLNYGGVPRLKERLGLYSADAIIFDDLCRYKEPGECIDLIDWCKREAKVTLITVNDVMKLDPSLVRGDRVNHVLELGSEQEGRARLIEGATPASREQLLALPIAYAVSYAKTLKTGGREAAEAEVPLYLEQAELVERIAKGKLVSLEYEQVKTSAPEPPIKYPTVRTSRSIKGDETFTP